MLSPPVWLLTVSHANIVKYDTAKKVLQYLSQNVLKEWLDKLSQKSEESEKHFELLKTLFPGNGADAGLAEFKEKMSNLVSKSDLEIVYSKWSKIVDENEKAMKKLFDNSECTNKQGPIL